MLTTPSAPGRFVSKPNVHSHDKKRKSSISEFPLTLIFCVVQLQIKCEALLLLFSCSGTANKWIFNFREPEGWMRIIHRLLQLLVLRNQGQSCVISFYIIKPQQSTTENRLDNFTSYLITPNVDAIGLAVHFKGRLNKAVDLRAIQIMDGFKSV